VKVTAGRRAQNGGYRPEMTQLSLPQEQCLALRAQAHALEPVVLLGAAGLSEAALKEIDRALKAHGLIKVRAGKTGREDLAFLFQTVADRLGAARIQAIGHTLVLYRPIPKDAKPAASPRPAKRALPPGAAVSGNGRRGSRTGACRRAPRRSPRLPRSCR